MGDLSGFAIHNVVRINCIHRKTRKDVTTQMTDKVIMQGIYSLMSGGNVVGGGGGQPLLASTGTSGVAGEKGTMSKMSVDCGFIEMLPACMRSHGKNLVEERS